MTLQEQLKKIDPAATVSLCNASEYHTEDGSKCYDAFFVGEAKDAPANAMDRIVIDVFTAFLWNTTTFILED